jgi:cytochrome c-L
MPLATSLHRFFLFASAATLLAATGTARADVAFRNALDDSPIDLTPIAGEEITDAVKSFRKTGTDPYVGNADAVAAGKALFEENCESCHNADGSGGMCPSLIDEVYANKRADTDVGKFEIIHSGAAGAMKAFSKRGITQDQMLKLIAYIHALKDKK